MSKNKEIKTFNHPNRTIEAEIAKIIGVHARNAFYTEDVTRYIFEYTPEDFEMVDKNIREIEVTIEELEGSEIMIGMGRSSDSCLLMMDVVQ